MKQHQGIWLPDHEKHMVEWMNSSGQIVNGKGTYQYKKWLACLPWIKEFDVAVDVGAHVGFWSMHMAEKFGQVHAFEPVAEFRACWDENLLGYSNAVVWCCGLGATPGRARMIIDPTDTGGTHIDAATDGGDIEIKTLDGSELDACDFIKVDCEGMELPVLQGAEDTLKRCHPCVIVEQKQHIMQRNYGTSGRPAVDFLMSLGAKLRKEISGDFICSW